MGGWIKNRPYNSSCLYIRGRTGVVFIWALSSPPTPSGCPTDAGPRPFPADAGPCHFPSLARPISAPARLLLPRTRAPAPPRPRVSDPAADARPLPGGWPPPVGRLRTARAGSFPYAGHPPQDLLQLFFARWLTAVFNLRRRQAAPLTPAHAPSPPTPAHATSPHLRAPSPPPRACSFPTPTRLLLPTLGFLTPQPMPARSPVVGPRRSAAPGQPMRGVSPMQVARPRTCYSPISHGG
ncbi:vegetative cell wall protein gp1-like [Miscanthus floridulus]|uniref:vegetative cell wall protein gp1-like n=1 Tax=Miscanthus floridulus TaxID=154761 RepID=UPI00345A8317